MTKIVLQDFASLTNETSALNALNANNTVIETGLENTLSRDGTSPNQMTADLDMNGNQILNLSAPASGTEPVRLQDLNTIIGGGTITAGIGRPSPAITADNAVVRWDGTLAASVQNSGVIVSDTNDITGIRTLELGTANSVLGTLKLDGNTSGTITVAPAAVAGTYTLTLPTALQASNAALVASSAGVLSFNNSINTAHGSQFFTGSGTYTPPAGVYHVYVEIWGGGGGGGWCNGAVPASGGGGGGYSAGYLAVTPGVGIPVTIGASGTGGTGTGTGGTGGTTTFGILSASGGAGGGDNGAGGGGGGGSSGGTINISGKTGSQVISDVQSIGGDAPRGGLGGTTGISSGAPAGGQQPGGGGGGGSTNGASQNGAVGGAGGVLVWW